MLANAARPPTVHDNQVSCYMLHFLLLTTGCSESLVRDICVVHQIQIDAISVKVGKCFVCPLFQNVPTDGNCFAGPLCEATCQAKKSHLCPKCVETEEARLEAEAAAREAEEEAAREEERRAAEEAARLAIQEAGRKAHAAIRAEQERLEAEEAARLQAEAAAIEAEEEAARAEHCRTAEEAARFTTQEAARRAELERLEAEAAEEAARLEAEAAAREAEQADSSGVGVVLWKTGLKVKEIKLLNIFILYIRHLVSFQDSEGSWVSS